MLTMMQRYKIAIVSVSLYLLCVSGIAWFLHHFSVHSTWTNCFGLSSALVAVMIIVILVMNRH